MAEQLIALSKHVIGNAKQPNARAKHPTSVAEQLTSHARQSMRVNGEAVWLAYNIGNGMFSNMYTCGNVMSVGRTLPSC